MFLYKKRIMSIQKICIKCGALEVVSDRSLGGRLICARCGSTSIRNKSFTQQGNKRIFYFVIFLFVLFIIII